MIKEAQDFVDKVNNESYSHGDALIFDRLVEAINHLEDLLELVNDPRTKLPEEEDCGCHPDPRDPSHLCAKHRDERGY